MRQPLALICTGIICLFSSLAAAQDPLDPSAAPPATENGDTGWSNAADLGIVYTAGNSSTLNFHFDNTLTRTGKLDIWLLRVGGLRTNTADDRFAVGSSDDFTVSEDINRELDSERYYVFSRYDRRISDRFFWVAGGGWERDKDAGILNRTSLFGGIGNIWFDRDDVRFRTDYALNFTAREDEIDDPERDERYSEGRLSSDFMKKIGMNAQFDSDFVFNVNFGDASDYRFDTINAVTSSLTDRFALRASLQLIYHNFPALEEIDLLDLAPEDGGVAIGTVNVRKKKLDTIFKVSLVITI